MPDKRGEFSNGPGTEFQSEQQESDGWAEAVRLRAVDPMDAETDPADVEFPLGSGNVVPR